MEADKGVVSSAMERQQDLILVVDDHEDSLLLLNFILSDLFAGRVIGFECGQAVLEQAASLQPSLILMDIVLPDIDGVAVMQQLRKDPRLRHIPMVAVTALANPNDRDRLLQAGFTDYISKPYLLEDMAVVVACYLQSQAAHSERE